MLLRTALFASVVLMSSSAFAQSSAHARIDQSRSSLSKNVFLTTSLEGEYGRVQRTEKDTGIIDNASWRGYGIRNGLGIEAFKFTQFSLSHTLLNLRSQDQGRENLTGSRLAAEFALSFSSPLANLQFGMGMLASNLQYQALEKSSSYTGTGHYYSVGANYFFSQSVSVQMIGKRIESSNKRTGGSADYSLLNANTDNLSLGIAVWL
ncbi:MAG: hypothetical protein EOP07_11195 [Proteobacteria bacterium]|nr:MAG: hypothetical protein EOP07_11195 [Pseudomonadota bacterium]